MGIRFYKYCISSCLIFFLLVGYAQKTNPSISDIDFNYNGEAIQINYSIINGSPESLYKIDVKAFTLDNSTILPKSISGDLTNIGNGTHSILWNQKKDNYTFDQQMQFELSLSLAGKYTLSNKIRANHIGKSLIFPGLGDYRLRNGKFYFFYGLAAYASVYGAYHFNKMANDNYDLYSNSLDYNQSQDYFNKAKQQQLFSHLLSLSAVAVWSVDLGLIYKKHKDIKNNVNKENSEYYYNKSIESFTTKSSKKHINTKEEFVLAYEELLVLYENKNYDGAIEKINKIKSLNTSEEILGKTKEIEDAINMYYQLENDYSNAISQGDLYFSQGKYENAIEEYVKATKLKSKESYPKNQILKVNEKISESNKENIYNKLITKANFEFDKKNYQKAKDFYNQAIDVINKPFPNKKIEEINLIIAKKEEERKERIAEEKMKEEERKRQEKIKTEQQKQEKIDQQYNSIISKADLAFKNKKYAEAFDLYDTALKFNPNSSKAKERKEICKNLLSKKEDDYNTKVKTYALIVGIEKYENGLSTVAYALAKKEGYDISQYFLDLKYTENDAFKFQMFLQSPEGGYTPKENIIFLSEDQASSRNIKQSLDVIMSKANSNDRVIFYFSGHGIPKGLCAYNATTDGLNIITRNDIEYRFKRTNAKHKILIADACFSGNLRGTRGAVNDKIKTFDQSLLNSKGGYAVLQSAGNDEYAQEDPTIKQGFFSFYLLEGLYGKADFNKDKIVTVKEAHRYLSQKVKAATGQLQNPQLDGEYEPNMPMSILK